MKNFNILTRRSFFDRSFKLGLAAALASVTDIPLFMRRALASGIGQPGANGKVNKVLFIWLRGANDGLNSVIPIQDSAYAVSRPTIKIPSQAGIDYGAAGPAFDATQFGLDDNNPANRVPRAPGDSTYSYNSAIRLGNGFAAVHPSLKFLAPVYNAGDLALVHRVAYPKQSQSHFDSQRYWENGTPNNNVVSDGIFYRAIVQSGLANSQALTGVSFQSSLPLILRGSQAAMTNLSDPTRYDLLGIPEPSGDPKATNALFAANNALFPEKQSRDLLALQYENLRKTLGEFSSMTFSDAGNIFQDDVKTDGDTTWLPINSTGASIGDPTKGYFLFPTSADKNGGWRRPDRSANANKYAVDTGQYGFFTNLKAAAMVLNNTDALIAGTELNGFDTHNDQIGASSTVGGHANLLRNIGWAIYGLRKYFTNYANRASWENVVVVTLSEFGRTTIENSTKGTDHAVSNVMFVAGGGVKGYGKLGRVTGVFNCNASGDLVPWATGTSGTMFGVSGRYLLRATDYRSVLGEIIRKHLGASSPQLGSIIPGYLTEPEIAAQQTVAASTIDAKLVTGEVGFL